MNELHVYDRISEAVGWTPMVRLGPTVDDFDSEVFAKIEFLNPMGSVKDRIARHMIEKAISDERLHGGDMVVENSSTAATWWSRTRPATQPWVWR
jgi:cysteine synthase